VPGTGVPYSTRTKSKLQFIQLVRVHRVTPVPGECQCSYFPGMHQPPKNGDEVTDYGNVIVTARDLASILGLTEQHLYNLRRRNVIQSIRAKRTEFLLGPSVRAYIQFKCGRDSPAEADFHSERAKKSGPIDNSGKYWSNKPAANCTALKMFGQKSIAGLS
jgi:hypothetical protein